MCTRSSLAAGVLVLALGCAGEEKASSAGAAQAAPAVEGRAAPGGASVAGEVKFVGRAHANRPIDMSEEAACKAVYQTTPHDQVVLVNPNGSLANVFVYVKSGLPPDAEYASPAMPVVIDQKGCMYHPRVFGMMVGQTLKIENSDPLLHNVKAMAKANRPFNISQPAAGMTTERTFTKPEVMLPLECNVHGWMQAYAGVLPHPFFSTTGADGRFTIKDLPPGTYTIEAWHERYGTRTATVTVQDNETKNVDFTYTRSAS